METAMMKLIEYAKGSFYTKSDIVLKATQLLEEEKKNIVDAYREGGKSFADFDFSSKTMDRESEDYYTQTFKQ